MHEFTALLTQYFHHWMFTLEVLIAYLIMFSLIACVLSPCPCRKRLTMGMVMCVFLACMVATWVFMGDSASLPTASLLTAKTQNTNNNKGE